MNREINLGLDYEAMKYNPFAVYKKLYIDLKYKT